MTVFLGMAPATASAGDPFHGIFSDNLSLPVADERAAMDRQAATGAGVLREHIFWDRIERTPGVYDWARTDQLVADAADRGLRILPVLVEPPAFYSSKPAGSSSTANWPPSNPVDMGRFAMRLVQRYGTNGSFWCTAGICRRPYMPMTHFQVWNEPDHPSWWKGRPSYLEYVPLLATVYTFVKLANPAAKVVSGGVTRTGVREGYLDGMLVLGGGAFFDTMAFHPYDINVANVVTLIREMRAKLDFYGLQGRGIHVTEYGWATSGRGLPVTTVPCQAALIHRMTTRLAELRGSLKLTGAIQFMWNDRPPTRDIWPFHAGLVGVDGSAKPALGAFTAAIGRAPAPAGLTIPEACPPHAQPTA